MPRAVVRLRFDPFLIVCLILGLFLFSPLLAPGLPQAPDGILHYYRSAIWRWAWDDGSLWPRWSTLLFQGYGYPALSFNGPLPYLVAGLASFVLPSVLAGFKFMLLLACVSYATGMYLWAREVLGPLPGLVAAAAYTFATIRFRELYFVGGAAQFLAWGLYPWVLYGFLRLAKAPTRGAFLLASLSLAAVVLSHNIGAMLFAPVLAVYLAYLLLTYRQWRWVVAAGALAVLISAIFWLPAIGEMPFTRAQVLTQGHWDVRVHFIRLHDLFAGSPALDARADNPSLPFNFGPLHLPLAALGLATVFLPGQARSRRAHLVMAAVLVVLASFMMLPQSYPVWQAVSPLQFAEYPWRIFGVALLGVSLLAGAALEWLRRWPKWQAAAAALLVLAIPASLMVYQFPRPFLRPVETPAAFLEYETAFRAIGTTAGNEFLPPWVTDVPAEPALTPDLARRALAEPRPGVTGEMTEARADRLALQVEAATAGPVAVPQFYFPGWRGTIDGEEASLRPAAGTGLIELDVPAGRSEVVLDFGSTPLRTAAAGLTLGGLALLAVGAALRRRAAPVPPAQRGDVKLAGLAAGLLAGLLVLKIAWIGPATGWFRLASPPDTALAASHPLAAAVGDQVKLLGYDLWPESVRPGQEFNVTLYWQATGPVDRDLSSFVHLAAGQEGAVFAQSDRQHPGYIPTTTWGTEQYVVDSHRVVIPQDAPPVAYEVVAGLYDRGSGSEWGSARLGATVHVIEQRGAQPRPEQPLAVQFEDHISLVGYETDRTVDGLEVVLYWRSERQPSKDYQVFLHVLDAGGAQVAGRDGPPVEGLYPTSRWAPGQVIADRRFVPLPPGSQPASVRFGLYDLATLERLAVVDARAATAQDNAVHAPVRVSGQ